MNSWAIAPRISSKNGSACSSTLFRNSRARWKSRFSNSSGLCTAARTNSLSWISSPRRISASVLAPANTSLSMSWSMYLRLMGVSLSARCLAISVPRRSIALWLFRSELRHCHPSSVALPNEMVLVGLGADTNVEAADKKITRRVARSFQSSRAFMWPVYRGESMNL